MSETYARCYASEARKFSRCHNVHLRCWRNPVRLLLCATGSEERDKRFILFTLFKSSSAAPVTAPADRTAIVPMPAIAQDLDIRSQAPAM